MKEPLLNWHVFADAKKMAEVVARNTLELAEYAISEQGRFTIVLAGGSTPVAVYRLLAQKASDWGNWHVYFGDERCVAADDALRNDSMARAAWLDQVSIPPSQIHSIPAELGPHDGARAYAETLAGVGDFDLVLLGLGEDGHTASLFPGQPAGAEPDSPDVLATESAPKPPQERISLSANRLSRSKAVKVLVTGAGKREAVAGLRRGDDIPICTITPATGLDVLLDEAAAVPDPGEPN